MNDLQPSNLICPMKKLMINLYPDYKEAKRPYSFLKPSWEREAALVFIF